MCVFFSTFFLYIDFLHFLCIMTCMCDREEEYCNLWNLHSFVSEFCDLFLVFFYSFMSV